MRISDWSSDVCSSDLEALIEIRADALRTLVRIAWHLGNRHLPTQLLGSMNPPRLRIRHDHVIADMVEGLGGHCEAIMAPFDPEGGAYAEGAAVPTGAGHHHHQHHHHDDHGHGHARSEEHTSELQSLM